jgi:hypothetical protein
MPLEAPATDAASLRKRVIRFVDKELAPLPPFRELARVAGSFGPMAIFGGLIRDLALGRSREFSSDVDLVLKDMPVEVLDRQLAPYAAVRNAFGGFRVQLGRWGFDLWTFETTWAFAKGFVEGRELADLLRTTFFNWDAALFELGTEQLIVRPSYFAEIDARFLAINLRQTPNEFGAAVRALRLIAEGGVSVAPDLAAFLHSQILAHGIDDLAAADAKRVGRRRLTRGFVGSVAIALREHQAQRPETPFAFFDFQPALPLPATSRASGT